MDNGYQYDLTIDRIDNNKGYLPDNCRWVTMSEQQRNKRSNKMYTINNETHCLKEWCEILNLNYATIRGRLNELGWSIEEVLEIKKRRKQTWLQ